MQSLHVGTAAHASLEFLPVFFLVFNLLRTVIVAFLYFRILYGTAIASDWRSDSK